MSKSRTVLEYVLVIVVIIGALLYMQSYLKRSMQGNLEQVAGRIGEQYALGLTTEHIHSRQDTHNTILNTPGWGHPWTIKWTRGTTQFTSTTKLPSLNKTWQPR